MGVSRDRFDADGRTRDRRRELERATGLAGQSRINGCIGFLAVRVSPQSMINFSRDSVIDCHKPGQPLS
jgi:hypothetical protein